MKATQDLLKDIALTISENEDIMPEVNRQLEEVRKAKQILSIEEREHFEMVRDVPDMVGGYPDELFITSEETSDMAKVIVSIVGSDASAVVWDNKEGLDMINTLTGGDTVTLEPCTDAVDINNASLLLTTTVGLDGAVVGKKISKLIIVNYRHKLMLNQISRRFDSSRIYVLFEPSFNTFDQE